MMVYIGLRKAIAPDISFILAQEALFENRYVFRNTADEHASNIEDPRHTYFIGLGESGASVAYAIIYKTNTHKVEFRRVVTAKKGQGTGIKFISDIIQSIFADAQVETVWLDVYKANEGALRLYRKLGFIETTEKSPEPPHPDFGPLIIMEKTRP